MKFSILSIVAGTALLISGPAGAHWPTKNKTDILNNCEEFKNSFYQGSPTILTSTKPPGLKTVDYGPWTLKYRRGSGATTHNSKINIPHTTIREMLGGLEDGVITYPGPLPSDEDRVSTIFQNENNIEHFRGPHGLLFRTWLRAASIYMDTRSNGYFKGNIKLDPSSWLFRYEFNEDRNKVATDGHLGVITCVDVRKDFGSGNILGYFAFKTVAHLKKVIVYPRGSGTGEAFPGSKVGLDESEVHTRFRYKLEAFDDDPGDSAIIEITEIETLECKVGSNNQPSAPGAFSDYSCTGGLTPLPRPSNYFKIRDKAGKPINACVDLQTTVLPGSALPVDPTPGNKYLSYCLGRCDGTLMVNTGD